MVRKEVEEMDKRITVKVDEWTYRTIKTLAWIRQTSISEVVRNIIIEEIKKEAYKEGLLRVWEREEFERKKEGN